MVAMDFFTTIMKNGGTMAFYIDDCGFLAGSLKLWIFGFSPKSTICYQYN